MDSRKKYVLTEDEFREAVREAISALNPRIIEEEPYDKWAEEELAARFLAHGTRLDRALDSLKTGKVGGRPSKLDSLEIGKVGGRPSKVDYWAEQDDVSVEDVSYDLPWPSEDHEMAIRSSATIAKLKDRLKESG